MVAAAITNSCRELAGYLCNIQLLEHLVRLPARVSLFELPLGDAVPVVTGFKSS